MIKGEVYRIEEKILEHLGKRSWTYSMYNLLLDILEAYPALYNRRVMQVEVQGEILDCWIYMISDFR